MSRTYNVIDADGHVLEPLDLWEKYIDPAFRDRAPRCHIDQRGNEHMIFEGRMFPGGEKGLGLSGGVGTAKNHQRPPFEMKYYEGRKGGFDPHARIADLDLDGIDAVFLYPSLGLNAGSIQDAPLAAAVCRAYNRWLADFCKPYPDRLFGVAQLPMQSVELAVEEMRHARKELGMRSGFVRPNRYHGRSLDDPAYDPLWAQAQELDFAIGLHEGIGGMPAVGADRFENVGARHIVCHTMEMMLASLSLIWGGVCERFPKVRFAFLESGGGWMAAWLDRMDRHFEESKVWGPPVHTKPSEIFRRQCWISFEPIEGTIASMAEYLGPNKILWATDYPHLDGFFPGAPAMIAEKLPPNIRRQVMAQGAIEFYNLR